LSTCTLTIEEPSLFLQKSLEFPSLLGTVSWS